MAPRFKWVESSGKVWRLYIKGKLTGGAIQCFNDTYYGTWEENGGGRTGPMGTLESCKKRVEAKVEPQ